MTSAEGDPHLWTWMAFSASAEIRGGHMLPPVRRDLARIARAIARFEPVSMLVRRDDIEQARAMLGPGIVVSQRPSDRRSLGYGIAERHLEILRAADDASGRPLRVEVFEGPARTRPTLESSCSAATYTNFYLCNGAVVAPEFGDPEADAFAKSALARLFPCREVVQIDIDAIVSGGAGINCTARHEPAD
ncbi:agmatine deiminase family protein [Nocardia sp. NBC_01503]|uniref:agmatine deiminase family protein n=1 Tax=Nocardia sp. NBC_01503 TaxID=2975997 RepID=UPI002E7AB5B2|nr:agmatine deiminase family protein [Nocardia sp. NBC_01503]WTL32113.1 agmatine deiminase family protein [Nocardia sp. NBC_01503]